jgi:hypothetical protein
VIIRIGLLRYYRFVVLFRYSFLVHLEGFTAFDSDFGIHQGPGPLVGPDELEFELIQTQMAQKPKLRAEVYARALCASQNVKRAEMWVGARCA